MSKVSQKEFVSHFEKLNSENAVYVWGGNGEIITKELMDKLYAWYGSTKYNRDYYNKKLAEGKGRVGADCSGALYPLSKIDRTAKGYYNSCVSTGLIAAMPKDIVCLVFNKNLTHVGAYLGNGYTIEMKSSTANVYKEKLKPTRWYYFGIPDFVDYSTNLEDTLVDSNVLIKNYQKWLNDNFKTAIAEDGKYGPKTKEATVKALQTIYNQYYGAKIAVDGKYGPKTKEACPGYTAMKKNADAYAMVTYIVHMYLYKEGYNMNGIINTSKVSTVYSDYTKVVVMDYQGDTRGLVVDGLAGTATLYQMFK